MNCKVELATHYFKHKLGFEQVEYRRHVGFRPVFTDRVIALPTLLRILRGDGDLLPRDFGSLAKTLGLKEIELSVSMRCHICKETVLCGMASRLLIFNYVEICHCREPSSRGAFALLESVDLLINTIAFDEVKQLTDDDANCLERIERGLHCLVGKPSFERLANRLREIISVARQI